MAENIDMMRTDITQAELDHFDLIVSQMGMRCNDWVPTMRDVEYVLIGRYQAVALKKIDAAMQTSKDLKPNLAEYTKEMKSLILFMRWIVLTCDMMEDDVKQRLESFVSDKINIVDGE